MTDPVKIARALLAPVVIALSLGCASVPRNADELFIARSYEHAARAYEDWLASHRHAPGRDRALFQLALIHALPDSPRHDPTRAAELFERVLDEHPNSPYAPPARLIGDLVGRVLALRRAVEAGSVQIGELEREAGRCREQLAFSADDDPAPNDEDALRDELSAERGACARALAALREQAAAREQELARLGAALEALKQIDLDDDPGRP